jgi:allantoicase
MDGWETRRRREEGHDWCLIQLASPFLSSSSSDKAIKLVGIEIDTAHFTGNHTPRLSIDIASVSSQDTMTMVQALPNGMGRLLEGGIQGSGHTPAEVQQAQAAIRSMEFQELLPQTLLNPGLEDSRLHYYSIDAPLEGNLIKVNFYPDGGVARLRFWAVEEEEEEENSNNTNVSKRKSQLYMPIESGVICSVVSHADHNAPPHPMPSSQLDYDYPELSSQEMGGTGLICSNKHFGEPWRLVQLGLGKGMWDGWETARHPSRLPVVVKNPNTHLIDSPLNDWCILKLGTPAASGVARVILDTKHFLGNYPESVLLEGCSCYDDNAPDDEEGGLDNATWFPLVERTRMSPNAEHVFDRSKEQLSHAAEPVSHVRLSIFPDGGVSRVRIYG